MDPFRSTSNPPLSSYSSRFLPPAWGSLRSIPTQNLFSAFSRPSAPPIEIVVRTELQRFSRDAPEHVKGLYVNFFSAPYLNKGNAEADTISGVAEKLYSTLFQPEWRRFWHVPPPTGPRPRWVRVEGNGRDITFWSLKDAQKAAQLPPRPAKKGRMCGKVLKRFDRTFACRYVGLVPSPVPSHPEFSLVVNFESHALTYRTCQVDPATVICPDCFEASDHEGHVVQYAQVVQFSTVCDCGDASAWKPGHNTGCSRHPVLEPGEQPDDRPIDFITDDPDVPAALLDTLFDTVSCVLEVIIHSLVHARKCHDMGPLPRTPAEMSEADPQTAEPLPWRGAGPWAVVVYSDDKHNANEIARQLVNTNKWDVDDAHEWVKDLDKKVGVHCRACG